MNLTKFSIDRPIGITMVIAFFVVLGLFSFYRIGVELLPALNTPYVTVSISYPGANADSVEQQRWGRPACRPPAPCSAQ